MRSLLALAVASLATTFATAAQADDFAFAKTSWSRLLAFSAQLAGRDLNGTDLNGDSLEGRRVAYVRLDDGRVDGEDVTAMWLAGTRFFGLDDTGHLIKPRDIVGAELVAQLDDDSTLSLYVADVRRHPDKHLRDVLGYEVWFETATGPEPLCGLDDDGAPAVAIPLAGRWSYGEGIAGGGAHVDDPFAFTFACEGYVLAKCVTAGYKPWAKTLSCQPGEGCSFGDLSAHHQACTRALRGDYFGDGTPHTVDGTMINLYDGYGLRYDSESWPIEAEWNEDGALCVAAPRLGAHASVVASLFDPACGNASFSAGALLVTELSP